MDDLIPYEELLRCNPPGVIRQAVATGALTRLERGTYTTAAPTAALRLRALQARVPVAIASHASAGALHGFADEPDVLHVSVPHSRVLASGPRLVVHRCRHDIEVVVRDGVRCTPVVATVLDLARWHREPDGLALADAAVHAGLTTPEHLRRELWRVRKLDGAARARSVADLCAVGAESPMESRIRYTLVAGGVARPTLQHVVQTARGPCRVDLAWPPCRVCLEYDGWDAHRDQCRFQADRVRWRALSEAGWDVHPVTSADLGRGSLVVAEIRRALERRAGLAVA